MNEYLVFSYSDFYPDGGASDLLTDKVSETEVITELGRALNGKYLEYNVEIYNINTGVTMDFIYDSSYYGYKDEKIYNENFLENVRKKLKRESHNQKA